jgi:hypothetical protein
MIKKATTTQLIINKTKTTSSGATRHLPLERSETPEGCLGEGFLKSSINDEIENRFGI